MDRTSDARDAREGPSGSRKAGSSFIDLTEHELDLVKDDSDTESMESEGGGTSNEGRRRNEDSDMMEGLHLGQGGSGPTYDGFPIFKGRGPLTLPEGLVSVYIYCLSNLKLLPKP